ncbi:hypothetical protein LZ32DRAFT_184961 [Colletotrichum eremochloae]|nr:hypothetical protein LZ32DRAFT_184961 [Colletotrichum eremochloae]
MRHSRSTEGHQAHSRPRPLPPFRRGLCLTLVSQPFQATAPHPYLDASLTMTFETLGLPYGPRSNPLTLNFALLWQSFPAKTCVLNLKLLFRWIKCLTPFPGGHPVQDLPSIRLGQNWRMPAGAPCRFIALACTTLPIYLPCHYYFAYWRRLPTHLTFYPPTCNLIPRTSRLRLSKHSRAEQPDYPVDELPCDTRASSLLEFKQRARKRLSTI